jgi:hypothetical protein
MLTVVPSEIVKSLVKQREWSKATTLYRQEGANEWDISYLIAAEDAARRRGISLDEALSEILNQPSGSTPTAEGAARAGCATTLPHVTGAIVLLFDFFGFLIILFASTTRCNGYFDPLPCGWGWSDAPYEVIFLGSVAVIGIRLIVLGRKAAVRN